MVTVAQTLIKLIYELEFRRQTGAPMTNHLTPFLGSNARRRSNAMRKSVIRKVNVCRCKYILGHVIGARDGPGAKQNFRGGPASRPRKPKYSFVRGTEFPRRCEPNSQ